MKYRQICYVRVNQQLKSCAFGKIILVQSGSWMGDIAVYRNQDSREFIEASFILLDCTIMNRNSTNFSMTSFGYINEY
ncbi:unnamed protein product [Paramecium octaurelia]|uniref:Uncharacterized protein n=1 Tax=Paramecium octaurelia TaxID=43137 RepID=A0A8S1VZF7_PAROT|nr:unnamed protein product [Paramecium octaurelia]